MARNLNDTQRLILSAAAARDDLRALPLPETLRAPAHVVKKTVAAMIARGLLGEITALPDDAVWTESNPGGRVTLIVTPAGRGAIGVEPDSAPAAVVFPDASSKSRKTRAGTKRTEAAPRGSAEGGAKQSKQDVVLTMLRRPEGASVAEMVAATHWQPHSVRGFMSGALKKRLGLEVTSEKDEKGERRYHVPAARAGETNT